MWQLLKIPADQDSADRLSDALLALGALSVSIEDAHAGTTEEQAIFGEPGMLQETWHDSLISALFDPATDVAQLLGQASLAVGLSAVPAHQIETLAEQDWVRLTQAQFDPIPISERLWIVPSWHVAPDPDAIVLVLDPGLAFGTGSHPTTRLCLQWLDQHLLEKATVLDYGCGSGILAIAAAIHGASEVDALDIDIAAVDAAHRNALANGVVIRCGTPELVSGTYHTLMANILATPLKVLAPLLCARVAPGGHLVLAGILECQADELAAAYAPYMRLGVAASLDGWILMTGTA